MDGDRLILRTSTLSPVSSEDVYAPLPDDGWNAWAMTLVPDPAILLGPLSGSAGPEVLWVTVRPGSTDIRALPTPSGLSFADYPPNRAGWFVASPWGVLRLVTFEGDPQLMRASEAGIDLIPVTLPAGSSRYHLGASEDADVGLLAAFGFSDEPGLEVALVGADGLGDFRRILDWDPEGVTIDVTTERIAVTAIGPGELTVIFLGAGLEDLGRTRLELDHIHAATTIGEGPRGLVAHRRSDGADHAVLYGTLPGGDRVEGLRLLLDGHTRYGELGSPVAWAAGDGLHVVAVPSRVMDVFLLCGGGA